MKAKRITALLLAILMLTANLVGCSESKTEANTDEPSAVTDTPSAGEEAAPVEEEPEDTRASISDDLPEKDYDGKAFRVLTTESKEYQFRVDELNGEVTNDEVFNRNQRIEDRFNVNIETVIDPSPYSTINTFVTAGTNECEIVDHYEYKAYVPIEKGSYLDWNIIPLINQEKPWWNRKSNADSTINGKLYCIVGDLSITSMQFTFAMFFDMDLMEQYGITSDQMYGYVFEGTWTLDKLAEIASQIYVDNDGDGTENEGDTFGYSYWYFHGTDVWVTAIGEKLTSYEDGKLTVTLGTEKVFNTLEKLTNLVYNTTGAHKFEDETKGRNEFIEGRIGIMQLMFEDCYGALRDMEYAYGVLPYPKYDEAQTEYYTNSMDQHSVFGVPKTLPEDDYEFVGLMMEALNAESYKTVYPAFYDTALKNKYSEDATTAQMIDLIMDGRVFEFSFQFGEYLMSLPYMFRNQLYNNSNDLASTLKKSQKALNKSLEKLYKMYE